VTVFNRHERPDFETDPEDWVEVCEITSDISFYEDPQSRLFIDAVDMEEMAGVINAEKAKKMIQVLMRYLTKFEGAQIATEEQNNG
jgi:predicted HTH transcriptional regulator